MRTKRMTPRTPLNFWPLERRQMLATVSLDSGTLLIEDAVSGGQANTITVSYDDANDVYDLRETTLTFTTSIPGAWGNGTQRLRIPAAGILNLTIDTKDGNDDVTIASVKNGMGDLRIYSGGGDDFVRVLTNINFSNDASVVIDLLADSLETDTDSIFIGKYDLRGFSLEMSGTGEIELNTGGHIWLYGTLAVESGNVSIKSGELYAGQDSIVSSTDGDIGLVIRRNLSFREDTLISSGDGDITIVSERNGLDDEGGMSFFYSEIKSTGIGEIEIIGDNVQDGMFFNNSSIDAGPSGGISLVSTVARVGFSSTTVEANEDIHISATGGVSVSGHWNGELSGVFAKGDANIYIEGIYDGNNLNDFWKGGVRIYDSNAQVVSENGNIFIRGVAEGRSGFYPGILFEEGWIRSTGTGSIFIDGTSLGEAEGVRFQGKFTNIYTPGGEVSIKAVAEDDSIDFRIEDLNTGSNPFIFAVDGPVTIEADAIDIASTYLVRAGGEHSVSVLSTTAGIPIDLGGEDVLGTALGLVNSELNTFDTDNIRIGDANSGAITISDPIAVESNLHLRGETLIPITPGIDVSASDSIVKLATGMDLSLAINGLLVDDEFDQLNIVGQIDLDGTELILTGTHIPSLGEQWVIVNNDDVDPVIGHFNGLPEGERIPHFLGSEFDASVSYKGTDGSTGNDVVITVVEALEPGIFGRHILYHDSSFDGTNDEAIDPSKQPLLPGGIAEFANYTSFMHGINGIAVDIAGLTITPTLDLSNFFEFRVGNDDTPNDWEVSPAPIELNLVEFGGSLGSDRVEVVWSNNAIQNQWLQVTVLANADTGLLEPSVFYWGNAIGETGNDPTNAVVNLADVALTRENQTGFGTADVANQYDFNRDGRVNLADVAMARENQSGFTPLELIDLSSDENFRTSEGGKGVRNLLGLTENGPPMGYRSKTPQAIEDHWTDRKSWLNPPPSLMATRQATGDGDVLGGQRKTIFLISAFEYDDQQTTRSDSGDLASMNIQLDALYETLGTFEVF